MSITLGKTPARLLLSMNVCATKEAAAAKVSAFREWYETRNEQEKAQIDYLREQLTIVNIANLGKWGIDELVASLILKADRRVGLV